MVRPLFLELVPKSISRNICVAIVTFSCQTDLITEVLKIKFPEDYSKIVIRANDNSWRYEGEGSKQGKQSYMASASMELSTRFNVNITRKSTLLIDDDIQNIQHALRNCVPAVYFDPDNLSK
jgi:hypothetical protein